MENKIENRRNTAIHLTKRQRRRFSRHNAENQCSPDQRHGIDVVSFGNSLHDPDCYYLIRAFDSAESMATVLNAFYASDDWRSGPREDIFGSIETSIKTVMNLPSENVEGLRVQS